MTPAEIDDLVDILSIQAEIIEPLPGTLLAALASSGADYLVTGDKDLLAMGDRHPIVTPTRFWAAHAGL